MTIPGLSALRGVDLLLPGLGEGSDGGVDAAFHGAERDAEHVRELGVTEFLEVGEEEGLFETWREAVEGTLDHGALLGLLDAGRGVGHVDGHEVDEGGGVVAAGGGGEGDGGSAADLAEGVAALVGGDGEQPRLEAARAVEAFEGLVDLEEGVLENVLGELTLAGEAVEEPHERIVVALDERTESLGVAGEMLLDQLLVRAVRVDGHVWALVLFVRLGGVEGSIPLRHTNAVGLGARRGMRIRGCIVWACKVSRTAGCDARMAWGRGCCWARRVTALGVLLLLVRLIA